MSNGHLHTFPTHAADGATGAPAGWTVLEGEPVARTRVHYLGEGRTMLSGFWECSPGKFSATYASWEFCHMLTGRCTITPKGGEPVTLEPGSAFILEPGFVGTWEVHEAMSKHFVFKLATPVPAP